MTKILFAALALMLAFSTAGYAANRGNPTGAKGSHFAKKHPRRNEVNKRVKNQRARINKDEKSGKITKAQGDQLKANDRAVKQEEHAEVKANGGHLTKDQQKQINQEENSNSKLIRDEAHPAGQ